MKDDKPCALLEIPLSKIVLGENSRGGFAHEDLSELMVSMKQHGLQSAIGVRAMPRGKYEVVYGNRRFVAAQKLGWETINAVIAAQCGSKEADIDFLIKNATENLQRVDPSFPEQGRLFHMLIKKGLAPKEIAARIGISQDKVAKIIEAYEYLPSYLRDKVVMNEAGQRPGGNLSLRGATNAINAIKHHELGAEKRREIYQYALQPGVTAEKIRRAAKLLSDGMPMDKVANMVGNLKLVTVNFWLTEQAINLLEKKHGCKAREVIYKVVRDSKEIPLARINAEIRNPKVIVRKKAYQMNNGA